MVIDRARYETFVNDLHHLSLDIGLNAAARAMGISEARARKISSRRRFNLKRLFGGNGRAHPNAPLIATGGPASLPVTADGIEAKRRIIEHYGDRAKIGATIAGAKALEHLADSTGAELVKPAAAISGDQWTKAVDRAAGWTAARQSPVQVAVQVNMPSAEEKAELRETDAKLDEIAALLRATRPQA